MGPVREDELAPKQMARLEIGELGLKRERVHDHARAADPR